MAGWTRDLRTEINSALRVDVAELLEVVQEGAISAFVGLNRSLREVGSNRL